MVKKCSFLFTMILACLPAYHPVAQLNISDELKRTDLVTQYRRLWIAFSFFLALASVCLDNAASTAEIKCSTWNTDESPSLSYSQS